MWRNRRMIALTLGTFALAACQEGSKQPLAPAFAAAAASLPHINNSNLPIPVSVNAQFTAEDCSNNPGPFITFDGTFASGGFGVELTFTNNLQGTHTYTADNVVDVSFAPNSGPVVIPKQPVLGGVGGNPFIWAQFVDGNGTPVSNETFLGRCVQGAKFGFNQATSTFGNGDAEFSITSCENSPGPFIDVTGGVVYDGLGVRLIFRNNDNPVGGPHEAVVSRAVTVVPAGFSLTFPKQPVLGGVGGNPWIFAGFLDASGAKLGAPTLLGRCVQISQSLS
jgi:hypothetical protein